MLPSIGTGRSSFLHCIRDRLSPSHRAAFRPCCGEHFLAQRAADFGHHAGMIVMIHRRQAWADDLVQAFRRSEQPRGPVRVIFRPGHFGESCQTFSDTSFVAGLPKNLRALIQCGGRGVCLTANRARLRDFANARTNECCSYFFAA